jgi:hypothetical protein
MGLNLIKHATKDFIPRSFYHVMIYNRIVHSKYFGNLQHCFTLGLHLKLKFELNLNTLMSIFRIL